MNLRYRVVAGLAALAIVPGLTVAASAAAAPPPKPFATVPGETVPVPVPPKPDPARDHPQPGKGGPGIVKGDPKQGNGGRMAFAALSSCASPCMKYSQGIYTSTGVTSVSSSVRVAIPSVDQQDGHTLAEVSLINGNNIIEIGWNRDRVLYGETYPTLNTHLFVSAWYNNAGTRTWCGVYNGGCGWTDYGANPINAGANITAQNGVQKQMQVVYSAGNWWVWYDTNWVGYFPAALGHGVSGFTTGTEVRTFGEIGAWHDPTCTDMGNSWLAHDGGTYPTFGADFGSLNIAKGGGYSLTNYTSSFVSNNALWAFTLVPAGGPSSSMRYGGPGSSPNPGACP